MDFSAAASWIVVPIQIFFLDLLLGADNAVVIAMACRTLPPRDVSKAVLLGTAGAIVFRFILTVAAGFLFTAPYLKLAGAVILLVIAMNLLELEQPGELDVLSDGARASRPARSGLWSAVLLILVVDATMSLDNVVAIAAIARGNLWLLALGVLFSIPVLMSGSLVLADLLKRYPLLVIAGCALLGWVAGSMAVDDPAIAGWANVNAPALVAMAPALGAAFVLAQALFLARDRQRTGRTMPARAPEAGKKTASPISAPEPVSPAPVVRLLETSARAAPASEAKRAAPRAADKPRAPKATGGLARAGNGREERMVMIGLILLTALAGAMIALVVYLDNLSVR